MGQLRRCKVHVKGTLQDIHVANRNTSSACYLITAIGNARFSPNRYEASQTRCFDLGTIEYVNMNELRMSIVKELEKQYSVSIIFFYESLITDYLDI